MVHPVGAGKACPKTRADSIRPHEGHGSSCRGGQSLPENTGGFHPPLRKRLNLIVHTRDMVHLVGAGKACPKIWADSIRPHKEHGSSCRGGQSLPENTGGFHPPLRKRLNLIVHTRNMVHPVGAGKACPKTRADSIRPHEGHGSSCRGRQSLPENTGGFHPPTQGT